MDEIIRLLAQMLSGGSSSIGANGENRDAPSMTSIFNQAANRSAREMANIRREVPSQQYLMNQKANGMAREQATRFKQPTSEYQMNEWRKQQSRRNLNFRNGGHPGSDLGDTMEWLTNELMNQNAKRTAGNGGW